MSIKYIDLFCGIGGFRLGATQVFEKYNIPSKCVFSSDIDLYAREAYHANFGEYPAGDITKIDADEIPDHDLLFAGFPCQPFSIIGNGKGFEDTRGTLFFDIARILDAKKPKAFVLENVKRLVGHNKGRTLRKISDVLTELGYYFDYRVLNALDYGLPQKRERVFIVGFHKPIQFQWPAQLSTYTSLNDILEDNVADKHYASERIKQKRLESHTPMHTPSVWHENKAGNISSYPYSCALRAGASYNYLLVNGERRLTPREMLRLQGFPDSYKIVVSDAQTRKQAGNAVPVNLVRAVVESFVPILTDASIKKTTRNSNGYHRHQQTIFLKEHRYALQKENAAFANSR
ncbi:MAG: DNA (cytosine-5-)-methyltransferase [Candidatus Cloacimonetes bacterium 4572_55]|nr:MAG: DNA (cytosine-5-)-methyltransferase [Candidatus Cloacimonetes bacterium 4572_55]